MVLYSPQVLENMERRFEELRLSRKQQRWRSKWSLPSSPKTECFLIAYFSPVPTRPVPPPDLWIITYLTFSSNPFLVFSHLIYNSSASTCLKTTQTSPRVLFKIAILYSTVIGSIIRDRVAGSSPTHESYICYAFWSYDTNHTMYPKNFNFIIAKLNGIRVYKKRFY